MPGIDKLAALGIPPISAREQPEIYAQLFRLARRLRDAQCRVVGLLPADDRVAVPPIALQLGLALSDCCSADVEMMDANNLRPALLELIPVAERPEAMTPFVTIQVAERLWVTTPPRPRVRGLDLNLLESNIERGRQRFAHVLLDMTGFDALGEQWVGCELVDGVLIVARAGVTWERDVLIRNEEVPEDRKLGVLLIG